MNPPSIDIKDILEAAGIGTYGTDLFVSTIPERPDAAVGIIDTAGLSPLPVDYIYDRPSVQIIVRGTANGYLAAYSKAESIKRALHALYNETWNGTRYIVILAETDILWIGPDERNRPQFSLNFSINRA